MLQNDFPRFITEQEMQVEELPWGATSGRPWPSQSMDMPYC
jgi:hypothetical protein